MHFPLFHDFKKLGAGVQAYLFRQITPIGGLHGTGAFHPFRDKKGTQPIRFVVLDY